MAWEVRWIIQRSIVQACHSNAQSADAVLWPCVLTASHFLIVALFMSITSRTDVQAHTGSYIHNCQSKDIKFLKGRYESERNDFLFHSVKLTSDPQGKKALFAELSVRLSLIVRSAEHAVNDKYKGTMKSDKWEMTKHVSGPSSVCFLFLSSQTGTV